jgi:hypothetical protein
MYTETKTAQVLLGRGGASSQAGTATIDSAAS